LRGARERRDERFVKKVWRANSVLSYGHQRNPLKTEIRTETPRCALQISETADS